MTSFWHKVLEGFNQTDKTLQTVDVDLETAIIL